MELLLSGDRSLLNRADCTPGYYNNEGKLYDTKTTPFMLGYPEGPVAYFQYINGWRSSGDFEGLDFR